MAWVATKVSRLTELAAFQPDHYFFIMNQTSINSLRRISGFKIGKSLTLLLGALVAFGFGCNKNQSSTGTKASPKATWDFWQTIQEPPPRNTLYQRMEGFNAKNASAQDLAVMGLLFRQMAETSHTKANQIASASVADVDVDAANYGVKKAQLLVEYAKMFERAAQLTEKQNELTSGEDWVLGFLFALARHSDEGEDAWGNALKEELVDKAKTFGNLEVDGRSVATFMQSLSDATANLQTKEMQTRIALAQRYGKEFPTSDALASQRAAPVPEVLSSAKLKPMREELMKNLIGRKIRTAAAGTWSFDVGEFKTFDVAHGTNYGDVVDFEVSTHVKGWFSREEHDFRLLMTYQKTKDTMKLMFVKPL